MRSSRPRVARSLPSPTTSFVGRVAEVRRLHALIDASRLLTVVGPAGAGKTRLAVRVAEQLADGAADRPPRDIVWIDLAADRDGDRFTASLASAFGIRVVPRPVLLGVLAAHLGELDPGGTPDGDTSPVIVFDNCEHLADDVADVIGQLLEACPGIRCLTTSRQPLGIAGEVTWRVPPLGLACSPGVPTELGDHDAAQLFLARSGGPEAGGRDAEVIADLCQQLDGNPLAIELVASAARSIPLEQVAAGVGALVSAALPAHAHRGRQPLHATLAWSVDALPRHVQDVLGRLSVFADSFTSDAALRVAGADEDVLATLVERSLVVRTSARDGLHHRLLFAVRTFVADGLGDAEREEVRGRLLDHVLDVARDAEAALQQSRAVDWLDRLELVREDIVASAWWALSAGREADAGDLISRLLWFWQTRGHAPEARGALEAAIARADAGPERRAEWLWAAARLAQYEWDRETTRRFTEEGAALAIEVGRPDIAARCRNGQAWMAMVFGEPVQAIAFLEEGLQLGRDADDANASAHALEAMATLRMAVGDWPAAWALLQDSVALARTASPLEVLVDDLIWVAWVALHTGDADAAAAAIDEGRALADAVGAAFHRSFFTGLAGALELRQGRLPEARALLEEADVLADLAVAPAPRIFCDIVLAMLDDHDGCADAPARMEALAAFGAQTVIMHISGELYARGALRAVEGGALDEADRLLGLGRTWTATMGQVEPAVDTAASVLATARGDAAAAVELAHRALADALSVGARPAALDALEALAWALAHHGDARRGAVLLGAADAHRERCGWAPTPTWPRRRLLLLDALADGLGAQADEERGRGAGMSLDVAIAHATRGRGARSRPTHGWESLTPAQLAVVRLAVEGLSNAQIAERLFVSQATVKTHLVHVFRKLDVGSRAQLAAAALREGRGVLAEDLDGALLGDQPIG